MKLTKRQFYFLSCTWGIVMSALGAAVAAILLMLGYVPDKNKYGWTFIVGEHWGGISLGPVSIVNKNPSTHILAHEFGHAIQNCFFGPFFLVLVAIPSAIRYWYREIVVTTGFMAYSELPPYDSIWFEGMATQLGEKY